MGISFAVDRRLYVYDILIGTFFHGHDFHSDAMRHFILQQVQCLFTDDFRRDLSFWLVSYHIAGEVLRAFGQIFSDNVQQFLRISVLHGRNRHYFRKVMQLAVSCDYLQQGISFHCVDLIDDQYYGSFRIFDTFQHILILRPYLCSGFNQHQHQIHFIKGCFRRPHHIFTQFGFGLMDTGCIQKYALEIILRQDGSDLISGGLGFMGCDCNFFTDQAVHQCGFAHIGSAYQRNETGVKLFHSTSTPLSFSISFCSAIKFASFASQSFAISRSSIYCSHLSFFVSISSCVRPLIRHSA